MTKPFNRNQHPSISEEERQLLDQGKMILAIKSYRERNATRDPETDAVRHYNLYDSRCVMEYERERLEKKAAPWADVPEAWDRRLTAEERAKFPVLTEGERLKVLNGQTVPAIRAYRDRQGTSEMSLNHARRVIEYDRDHIADDRTPEQKAEALQETVRDIVQSQARTISRALGLRESDVFAQFVFEANQAYNRSA